MVNKSKWVNNFNGLSPDSQLEVAEAIARELKENEQTFDEGEYEKEKSKMIRNFFNSFVLNAGQSIKLKTMKSLLQKYKSLSPDYQKSVVDECVSIVSKYSQIQEQEKCERTCQQEGHIFGNWEHNEWTTYIDTVIDHQYVRNFPLEHENWSRKCCRCGFVHIVEKEPQELIAERKERERKARIKSLESELNRLKNNQ